MSNPLIDAELNEPDGDFQSHCSEFEGPFSRHFFFSVILRSPWKGSNNSHTVTLCKKS